MNEKVEKARLIKREERQEYRRREQRKPMIQSESRARRAADDVVRGWIESRREQKSSAHASFAALFAD
ncbi:MAG: hypothetical protein KF868_01800 [Acidobacteria bacterium]|nr:hypothetical protein [Acidobacteriota bacterium]MCW5967945.1 hypothetical protein [Blastocatellales bacterium]